MKVLKLHKNQKENAENLSVVKIALLEAARRSIIITNSNSLPEVERMIREAEDDEEATNAFNRTLDEKRAMYGRSGMCY